MPRLIHLNGPPGVGKSTLAQRYAADHHGALNLDIDIVAALIGGWRDDFFGVLPSARRIAVAMADAHLRDGRDVVLPQLVTNLDEVARFETTARLAGAEYVEIALTVGLAEQVRRFRLKANRSEVNAEVDRVVTAEGGRDFLERVRGHFDAYIAQRPNSLGLVTSGADVEESYARMLAVVDDA